MIARPLRAIARWHYSQQLKDVQHQLSFWRAQQANLPAAIARAELEERALRGRLDSLRQPKSRVSFTLAGHRR